MPQGTDKGAESSLGRKHLPGTLNSPGSRVGEGEGGRDTSTQATPPFSPNTGKPISTTQ